MDSDLSYGVKYSGSKMDSDLSYGVNYSGSRMEVGVVTLSKTKTVERLCTGDVVISRRKQKSDGSLESNAYEIFIDAESCRELVKKNNEITGTMNAVESNCLPNPTNVALANNRVVQVSLFKTRPKFGIHKLDEAGRLVRCMGLNFSPTEFAELVNFLTHYYTPPADETLSI